MTLLLIYSLRLYGQVRQKCCTNWIPNSIAIISIDLKWRNAIFMNECKFGEKKLRGTTPETYLKYD